MQPASFIALLALAACTPGGPKGADSAGGDTSDTGAPDDTGTGDTDGTDSVDTDAADTPVTPTEEAGFWVFQADDLMLVIDPATGARVARLALGATDLLTDAAVDPDNWGATFWTSPQSAWTWPPPAAIDNAPYTATLDGDTLVLTSGEANVGGATLTVEKRIAAFQGEGGAYVTQTYVVRNAGTSEASLAGWQIARVPADALTVFPAGTYVNNTSGELPYAEEAGHVWFTEAPAADGKVLADGAGGWIATVTGGVAFRVAYPDVAPGHAAPGEAEVEVFGNGGGGYREVEVQGEYTTLAPGESLSWTVRWDVAAVPGDISATVGSTALTDFLAGMGG